MNVWNSYFITFLYTRIVYERDDDLVFICQEYFFIGIYPSTCMSRNDL